MNILVHLVSTLRPRGEDAATSVILPVVRSRAGTQRTASSSTRPVTPLRGPLDGWRPTTRRPPAVRHDPGA